MSENIMVSVYCTAYNHEKYIRSALDGFVMQRTNFKFEVIIHDDASTDKTADVIREYAERYPDIIKPIYQTENQYSKGVCIFEKFIQPQLKGRYIASCEGDDYWIDEYKLQKQFDAMERHQEIDICAHATKWVKNGKIKKIVKLSEVEYVFSTSDVVRNIYGDISLAALFYRASLYQKDLPSFIKFWRIDFAIKFFGALRGGVLYLPDVMSVYRIETESSWTKRMRKDPTKHIEHLLKKKKLLNMFNADTNYAYSKAIEYNLVNVDFKYDFDNGNYSNLLLDKYKEHISQCSWKFYLYTYVMALVFGNRHKYEKQQKND